MNKYHTNTGNGKFSGGEGGSNKAQGRRPTLTLPNKTANWPGAPGNTQSKSRSAGMPETGKRGPFYVKKDGL